jgi:hypothetical protein
MSTGPLDNGLILIGFVLFALKAFALFDVCTRQSAAFPAADKQTKGFWLILLGIATVWDGRYLLLLQTLYFSPIGILEIVGTVAALVYMVDARPAVRSMGGGGRRQGPYGPW